MLMESKMDKPTYDIPNSFLPLGILRALDVAVKELYYIAILSLTNESEMDACPDLSVVTKETRELFSSIDENSTKEECEKVLNQMNELNEKGLLSENNMMNKTKCLELYEDMKRFRNQVKKLLAEPTNVWLKLKWMENNYSIESEKLEKELLALQLELEKSRQLRGKTVKRRIDNEEGEKVATHNFQAKHPQRIKANMEEEIEFIRTVNEEKLKQFRKDEVTAENRLKDAIYEHRNDLQAIIDETLNTKTFYDWLKRKSEGKLKELNIEQEIIWNKLSVELEMCHNQCLKYAELDKSYNVILKEKELKEYEKRLEAAAITIQARWRGNKCRYALKHS